MLTELLERHHAADAHERKAVAQMQSFLRDAPSPFGRDVVGDAARRGHITGSAWIVDAEELRVVLLYHAKLGKWVQPGGHCDGDENVLNVALREAREETGLDVSPISGELFDVDTHRIPEYWNTPAHFHYDARFLLHALSTQQPQCSDESREVRWVSLDEAEHLAKSESVARMVRKTRALFSG